MKWACAREGVFAKVVGQADVTHFGMQQAVEQVAVEDCAAANSGAHRQVDAA